MHGTARVTNSRNRAPTRALHRTSDGRVCASSGVCRSCRRTSRAEAPTELRVECDLASPDGLVAGRLDLLIVGEQPAVVDYKSGGVTDDDDLRSGYARQLALYAWLASTTLELTGVEAALFSLREGLVAVDVSDSVQESIVAEAREARNQFNARVPSAQPATPTVEVCRWCKFACDCDEAWRALDDGRIDRLGWGEAGRGRVVEPATISRSGRAALTLDVEHGTVAGQATIIDIPAIVTNGLARGTGVSVIGLSIRSDEPLTLAWRDGTSVLASTDQQTSPQS